jgi:hypothetical protein
MQAFGPFSMRPRVRRAAQALLCSVALLPVQASLAAGGTASLAPLEFSVVDLRPEDGVAAGYSLDGEPMTFVNVAIDNVPRSTQRVGGWWTPASALTTGAGAVVDSNGYATFSLLDSTGWIFADIYSTSDSGASSPFQGGSIVLQAGTQLTVSSVGAAAASCESVGGRECSAYGFAFLALGGAFGGSYLSDSLQVSSQGAAVSGGRLMTVSYLNTSDQPLDINYIVQLGTLVAVQVPVPEPGTAMLLLAGMLMFAGRQAVIERLPSRRGPGAASARPAARRRRRHRRG